MRSWTEKGKVVFFFSHFSLGWSEIWVLTEYGTCKSVDLCISCHSGKQWRRWEVGAEEEGSESLSGTGKWNFIFIASINNQNFKLWLCKTAKKKMSTLSMPHCTVLNDPYKSRNPPFLFCITNAVFSANNSVFMFLSVIFTSEWCLHAKSSVIF